MAMPERREVQGPTEPNIERYITHIQINPEDLTSLRDAVLTQYALREMAAEVLQRENSSQIDQVWTAVIPALDAMDIKTLEALLESDRPYFMDWDIMSLGRHFFRINFPPAETRFRTRVGAYGIHLPSSFVAVAGEVEAPRLRDVKDDRRTVFAALIDPYSPDQEIEVLSLQESLGRFKTVEDLKEKLVKVIEDGLTENQ